MAIYIFRFILYIVIFFNQLYANSTLESALNNRVYQKVEWLNLLHFRDGESQIDSEKFFLSPNGKKDSKSELIYTIKALFIDKSKELSCKYIARYNYLVKELNLINNHKVECKDFNKFKSKLDLDSISLLFPTSYMNSPASMFGHTFLKLNSKRSDMLSYSVNYSAITNEKGGLSFAYKGLFGKYKGAYSIEKYYKKIKEYSYIEHRDIWEYKLKLTNREIEILLMHLWEIKDSYSTYYFLTKNCSYNILWLLEVVNSDFNLINSLSTTVTPIDTIRILSRLNLIDNISYKVSKSKKIEKLFSRIEQKELAFRLIYLKNRDELIGALDSSLESDAIIKFLIEYLEYQYSKHLVSKEFYRDRFLTLLRYQSRLDNMQNFSINMSNPINGHLNQKVSLTLNNSKDISFGYRFSYHSRSDFSNGYLPLTSLEFFKINFEIKNKSIQIREYELLNIESFNSYSKLLTNYSWKITLLNRDRFNSNLLKIALGYNFEIKDNFYFYTMGVISLNSSNKYILGLDYMIGLDYELDRFKFNIDINSNRIKFDKYLKINRNLSLTTKTFFNLVDKSSSLSFGFNYYF